MNKRDIKYRVWITPFGNAEPASHMEVIPDLELHVYFGNWERGGYKDAIFQLGSGIKDKNGVEIYEGDIIRGYTCNDGTEVVSEVLFSPHLGFYIDDAAESWDRMLYDGGIAIGSDVEVMGNVFENPNLIGEYEKRMEENVFKVAMEEGHTMDITEFLIFWGKRLLGVFVIILWPFMFAIMLYEKDYLFAMFSFFFLWCGVELVRTPKNH